MGIALIASILWLYAFWRLSRIRIPNDFWIQLERGHKKKSKRRKGYRSPEEFHADFESRYGKPGPIPEDVGLG